jgi:hypothetical protein
MMGKVKGRALAGRLATALLSSTMAVGCWHRADPAGARDVVVVQGAVTSGDTISSAKLQLQTKTNLCGAKEAQDYFQVVNKGTSAIKVSDITIKYWINDTSGQPVVPHVWTGGCLNGATGCFHQVTGVSATATKLAAACGPDAGHQASWEITIANSDATQMGANITWANLQTGFNLANYANFSPGSGTWYSACLPGQSYAEDSHYAIYVKGNLVFSSAGITTPTCRSPKGQQTVGGHLTSDQLSTALGTTCSGVVDPSTVMELAVGLPVSSEQALADKVVAVSDPNSPSYGQYLSEDEFIATFSPPVASQQAIIDWAAANGLTVTGTYPNRLLVDVSGTADQVEKALFTNLAVCNRPDGTQFFAPDRQPSLNVPPTAPVRHVSGIDSFAVAEPMAGGGTSAGLHGAADLKAAYNSCTTLDGSGQSVGLITFAPYAASDIALWACKNHIVTCDINDQIVSGTVPAVVTKTIGKKTVTPRPGEHIETTLDIEMAIAMAPGLSRVVEFRIQGGNDIGLINDALNAMLGDSGIKQGSTSWVLKGDANTQTIFRAMAVRGRTFFTGSGDQGSSSWTYDPGEVIAIQPAGPGSEPPPQASFLDMDGVTVVGGTILKVNGGSGVPVTYQSETTWNFISEGASGGGIAKFANAPGYQMSFSNAVGGAGKRVLPDISMVASNNFQLVDGIFNAGNGTSASSPLMAGWAALANQQRDLLGLSPIGFINPFLYEIGGAAPVIYNGAFNDIVDGNTAGTCTTGSGPSQGMCGSFGWKPSTTSTNFSAGPGYDLATGLGSPKCFLLQELGTKTITAPPPPPPDGGVDAGSDAGAGGAAGTGAGGGGAGGAGGSGGTVAPYMAVVATEGQKGVRFCMQGGGFTPGHLIKFTYLNVPKSASAINSIEGGLIVGSDGKFTEYDPTFGGGASSMQGFVQFCTAEDLSLTMTIQVVQDDDPSLAAVATIPNTWICGAEPKQTSTTETPLPFPPLFGTTTCPLPPE